MIGNFLGRIYYFPPEKRTAITGFTLLTNFAQFVTSLAFGFAAVMFTSSFYPFEDIDVVLVVLSCIIGISIVLYYYGEYLIPMTFSKWRINELREALNKTNSFRTKVAFLAALRFVIFTTQFGMMLMSFGVEVDSLVILSIWKVYLLTMMAPSLILGKIGIKESISLFVLTSIGINDFSILFTSLIIFSPALLGLIVCRRRQFE
jgi:hypothetical protein